MAQTAPTPITAAPTAPDRADRVTFSSRATAWADWQKVSGVPGMNATATNVYDNAVDAYGNATAASGSAGASAASATLAKQWATKTSAEVVAGQGFGAKKYADDAALSESAAASDAANTAVLLANAGSMLGINFGAFTMVDNELIVTHLTTATPSIVNGDLILDYETL